MGVIEKSVLVPMKVDDLYGLYIDLRRAEFQVRNVGSDTRGTYVYLDPSEEKDPAPIVECWVGKPAPKPSIILRDTRVRELKKIEAEEEQRTKERLEAQRKEAEESLNPTTEEEVTAEAKFTEKVGFLKRIFRKFF